MVELLLARGADPGATGNVRVRVDVCVGWGGECGRYLEVVGVGCVYVRACVLSYVALCFVCVVLNIRVSVCVLYCMHMCVDVVLCDNIFVVVCECMRVTLHA